MSTISKINSVPMAQIAKMLGLVATEIGSIGGIPTPLPIGGIDEYTKLMLHFDGTGATIVDSELTTQKTVTANGNATQSNTQSKFGGKSLYLDGTNSYITVADSADWDFGTADFTIDFWLLSTEFQTSDGILGSNALGDPNWQAEGNWLIACASSNAIEMFVSSAATRVGLIENIPAGWNHYAFVKNSGTYYSYLNGTLKSTMTDPGAYILISSSGIILGRQDIRNNYYVNGYIDELRISKGIARWTSNFTPPAGAYTV